MNVDQIMSKDVQVIGLETTVFDAAQKMRFVDVGVLPIVDHEGNLAGTITDRDIVTRVVAEGSDPHSVQVAHVMTSDPVTCRPDCPIDHAASTMRERQIRRLIVTEDHHRNVVGILSLGDLAVRGGQDTLVGEAEQGVCHGTS